MGFIPGTRVIVMEPKHIRLLRAINSASYFLAAIAGAIGIWWCWRHGWPWPFNSSKIMVYLFMGVPMAVLWGIVAIFYPRN